MGNDVKKIPDLSVYRKPPDSQSGPTYKKPADGSTATPVERRQYVGMVDWEEMKLFVEVKRDHSSSPFPQTGVEPIDSNSTTMTVPTTNAALETRGQLAEYASQLRLHQHRTFSLSVIVVSETARFLRWDQVGAIVSQPINYKQSPHLLLRFFYYIGQMSDDELGWDPTVRRAEDGDEVLWRTTMVTLPDRIREALDLVLKSPKLYRVKVPGDDLATAWMRWEAKKGDGSSPPPRSREREFIIGKYAAGHHSPTGRGTKGYLALDPCRRQFVYLKDSWQPDYSGYKDFMERSEPEIITYYRLHDNKVDYIATVVCGGDVSSDGDSLQTTVTHDYLDKKYLPRVHTRLVVEEVGLPLSNFLHSNELVNATYDGLLGEISRQSRSLLDQLMSYVMVG